jgi:hypothetical protein
MLLFLKVFVCKKSFGKNAEQRTKPKLGSGSNVLSNGQHQMAILQR